MATAHSFVNMAARLLVIESKIKAALYGMYIGDALAMPVHWYYDKRRIKSDFGSAGIQKYEAPVKKFPGSIMNLSNTGGGGRGSDEENIIGDVILHGKKKFWLRGGSYHYHHGMKAGENTLDTLVARVMLRTLLGLQQSGLEQSSNGRDIVNLYYTGDELVTSKKSKVGINTFTENFLDDYIEYMTTPDSHNDVYAATAHRMFFANYVDKVDKFECADNDGHNTDAVDGVINVLVVSLNEIVVNARKASGNESDLIDVAVGIDEGNKNAPLKKVIFDSINVVRRSKLLPTYGYVYHNLISKLIVENKELRQAIVEIVDEHPSLFKQGMNHLSKERLDQFRNTGSDSDPMSACYVSSNFPVTLMLAYKYADSLEEALLASANAGGENVNRNALLGGIMGASTGMTSEIEALLKGLVYREKIIPEVEQFAKL